MTKYPLDIILDSDDDLLKSDTWRGHPLHRVKPESIGKVMVANGLHRMKAIKVARSLAQTKEFKDAFKDIDLDEFFPNIFYCRFFVRAKLSIQMELSISANIAGTVREDHVGDLFRKCLEATATIRDKDQRLAKCKKYFKEMKDIFGISCPAHYLRMMNIGIRFLEVIARCYNQPYFRATFNPNSFLHLLHCKEYQTIVALMEDVLEHQRLNPRFSLEEFNKLDKATKKTLNDWNVQRSDLETHLKGVFSQKFIIKCWTQIARWESFVLKFAERFLNVKTSDTTAATELIQSNEITSFIEPNAEVMKPLFDLRPTSNSSIVSDVDWFFGTPGMKSVAQRLIDAEEGVTEDAPEAEERDAEIPSTKVMTTDVFAMLRMPWSDWFNSRENKELYKTFPRLILIDPPYFQGLADWDSIE
jgi:hypothetical protein